jgi:hypothetical protein
MGQTNNPGHQLKDQVMKANLKVITLTQIAYINLSERLREELELKIETLYMQNRMSNYRSICTQNFQNPVNADILCAYLISESPRTYEFPGKLTQGINTWFNMYYDDRLSVIDKFRICYQKTKPYQALNDKTGSDVVFCKFLIDELLTTLADSRWETLINHPD